MRKSNFNFQLEIFDLCSSSLFLFSSFLFLFFFYSFLFFLSSIISPFFADKSASRFSFFSKIAFGQFFSFLNF